MASESAGVVLFDATGVAHSVKDGVAIPALTPGLITAGKADDGKARYLETRFDSADNVHRLQVSGKVSLVASSGPPTAVNVQLVSDTPLIIAATSTHSYTITAGKTFTLIQVEAGAEGDPTENGTKIEVIYKDAALVEHLITRVYVAGFSQFFIFPTTSKTRDGTTMTGTGTQQILLRRTRLSGGSLEVDALVRGFEV